MKKLLFALLILVLPTLVLAQAETTGRITGKVLGEDNKPIAGARVTVNSPALLGQRSFTTDENGSFLAPLLPPGDYTVTVSAPGMEAVGYKVTLGIGQTAPLEAVVKPGGGTEEVVVYGDLSKLQTTSLGENFSYSKLINELPVVNRDLERVAELAPNISFGPTPGTLTIAGAPSFDTLVLLDGAEISDPYFGNAPVVYVEEALEEVQVLTSGVNARYGRFQGGVINATTKSGGNTYDGTARLNLDKETWNETTPFNEGQSDKLNTTTSAALGGPILKDRLTFFVSGRTIERDETLQTAQSAIDYLSTTEEDRWQVKFTGSPTADHVLEGSYLRFDRTLGNRAGLPPADLLSLAPREDPRKTTTFEYQGVLSDRMFLNVQGTRKRVSINSGGDPTKGHPFLDFYALPASFQIWHNHWWDFDDASLRNNDTASASLTHTLSSGNWGDNTLEYGAQWVRSTTGGENKQSSTGFNLLVYDQIVSGNEFSNVNVGPGGPDVPFDPNDPRFNLISYFDPAVGVSYRWEALTLGGDQELKNLAAYVQETWQKGKWRVDAGLRWENYDGRGPEPTLDLDFDELSPRLGVTYNLDMNWQLQATWGKYASRFNDNVASSVSGVGGAPYIVSLYTGPPAGPTTTCPETVPGSGIYTHCLTYNDVQAIIDDDANWGIITTITDPKQPTRFLASNAHSPVARDLNFTVKRALPKSTGTVTVTYTDRSYTDLLDDFVGDLGVSTVVDPQCTIPPCASFDFDTTIWKNAPNARRDYQALTGTFDYRPSARWNIGGNWTYAKTRGNYEGEGRNTPASGSIIGDYVRSIPQADAVPYGFTDDDIRQRIRTWGNYRFTFGRAGALTLGGIGLYQSALPYSKTAGRPLGNDPNYLNDAGLTYTHFFDGRGNNRFNGLWRLDFSGRHEVKLYKDLDFFVKFDILNVTNNDELLTWSTSGTSELNSAGVRSWAPTGRPDDFNPNLNGPDLAYDPLNADHVAGPGRWDCVSTPSRNCTGFGQIRNKDDYQLPRSYFFAVGLSW